MEAVTLQSVWFQWIEASFSELTHFEQQINQINVFPVPDSDTGSNMRETLGAMLELAPKDAVVAAMRSARGNSGTLLAVWFQTVVRSLGKEGVLTPESLHMAFFQAAQTARSSVTHAVEGTILLGMDSVAKAEIAGELPEHIVYLAETAGLAVAESALVLQEAHDAHTVDAGALGFFLILNSLSKIVAGRGLSEEHYLPFFKPPQRPVSTTLTEGGVEVVCEMNLPAEEMAVLRSALDAKASSVGISRIEGNGSDCEMTWLIHAHAEQESTIDEVLHQFGQITHKRVSSLIDGNLHRHEDH